MLLGLLFSGHVYSLALYTEDMRKQSAEGALVTIKHKFGQNINTVSTLCNAIC